MGTLFHPQSHTQELIVTNPPRDDDYASSILGTNSKQIVLGRERRIVLFAREFQGALTSSSFLFVLRSVDVLASVSFGFTRNQERGILTEISLAKASTTSIRL